ncbi:MAG: hypothetical protein KIS76_08935 [Pyrinomonadaceae bacterium]|nr:hypothetical protein [Pyrinomonadaceae bacterium]
MKRIAQLFFLAFLFTTANSFGQTPDKSVDFYNFTYQPLCGKTEPVSTAVRNGLFYEERQIPAPVTGKKSKLPPEPVWERKYFRPFEIVYGDLSGDGVKEAVVLTTCSSGGIESYTEGFIFSTKDGEAALIARLDGGDRAAGGLRSARVDGGILILERSRPGILGDPCCAEFIETSRYKLENGDLQQIGEPARVAIYPPTSIAFSEGTSAVTFDLKIPKSDEFKRFSIRGDKGQTLYVSTTSPNARLRLFSGNAELIVNPKPAKKNIAYRATNVLEAKLRETSEFVFEIGNISDTPDNHSDLNVTVSVELKQ